MPLRIANFMDSPLSSLERKGNLSHALALYNPMDAADRVVHFTPFPDDRRYQDMFAARHIDIAPYFHGRGHSTLGSLVALPTALLRVVRRMRRDHINIVRGRLPYFGSLIGCLAGRLLGVPTVVSLGGDNRIPQQRAGRYYFGSRRISFAVETFVLRHCNAIIVPNAFTRGYVERIIGQAAAGHKTTVIPWIVESAVSGCIRTTRVDRAALGLEPGVPFALIVGHVNEYKYSREMFGVAEAMLRGRPGRIQFVFCGDGPLRSEGEARLRGLRGARFVGWQPNDVVLSLLSEAAVVLVPMSGFVLLEAASRGAAVIASNVEWHSELIVDGRTGWLVPPDAIAQWVGAVHHVLDHPDDARSRGERLKQAFDNGYAPEEAFRSELELYARLGASPSPKAAALAS